MASISIRSAQSLLLLGFLTVACGEPAREARQSEYDAPPAAVPAPATPAPATAPVNTPSGTDAELDTHLDAAHENFVKKDLARAGDEIRDATSRLKAAAEGAKSDARKGLLETAQKLEEVEGHVRSGALTAIATLDRHLASANAALARDHYVRATDAWATKDGRTAGREMAAAMDQLEAGSKRLGEEAKGEAADFGKHVRDTGHKLAGGATVAETEVGKTIESLGRKIEMLAQKARSDL
ncbi:MAG: hypothetical protein ACREMA_03510 [Longimicrobiales bacterium]